MTRGTHEEILAHPIIRPCFRPFPLPGTVKVLCYVSLSSTQLEAIIVEQDQDNVYFVCGGGGICFGGEEDDGNGGHGGRGSSIDDFICFNSNGLLSLKKRSIFASFKQ